MLLVMLMIKSGKLNLLHITSCTAKPLLITGWDGILFNSLQKKIPFFFLLKAFNDFPSCCSSSFQIICRIIFGHSFALPYSGKLLNGEKIFCKAELI